MNGSVTRHRIESLYNARSKDRDWAADQFNAAQRLVVTERTSFFDKLVLFHSGTIAATISFAGILRQSPRAIVQWKPCLFSSWLLLFAAMVVAVARNWKAQNAFFYLTSSEYEKHEGALTDAYAKLVTSGGEIVDRETGNRVDPTTILTGAAKVTNLRTERSEDNKKSAEKAEKHRVLLEKLTFAMTGAGVLLALIFAIRNFY